MIGSKRRRHVAAVAAAAAGAPPNQAVIENYSTLDRLAVGITDRVGSMTFFLVIFGWTVVWVGYNILASRVPSLHWHAFDPFPAFVAYLLVSNVIQIWLMPLLLVGQNIQGRHSEARAEADYLVNQKSFADAETILNRIEAMDRRLLELQQRDEVILQKIAANWEKLGAPVSGDQPDAGSGPAPAAGPPPAPSGPRPAPSGA